MHLGDSWLVTNPNLAWGSSVALAHARALGDAFDDHWPDIDGVIDNFHQRTSAEVEQLFEMACETSPCTAAALGAAVETTVGRRTRAGGSSPRSDTWRSMGMPVRPCASGGG